MTALEWKDATSVSHDDTVLRGCENPFQATGGHDVLEGPLRTIYDQDLLSIPGLVRHFIEAPARVFHSQEELHAAFKTGELHRDVVAVCVFTAQRPTACRSFTA